MEGKTALGASSPANPALHIPDPLSTTRAEASSSHILTVRDCLLVEANELNCQVNENESDRDYIALKVPPCSA